ncbi:HNH endonuclease [Vreelandella titanicae]|nr:MULTISPECIES: HNH endonuclease [unclassified Halomonas]
MALNDRSEEVKCDNYTWHRGTALHHLDNVTIQFIPTKLHGNIPHIGSA